MHRLRTCGALAIRLQSRRRKNKGGNERSDSNSNQNQRIKGKFVEREVLACFSYEMEAVLKANQEMGDGLPSYDDIVNLCEYKCPNCGQGYQNQTAFMDTENLGSEKIYTCPECKHIFDNDPESEPQEIFEWWIVTDYLAEKLSEKGEPVVEWGNNHYWGRTCMGQSILLDGVISSICHDMEILEGQTNEWKD